MDVVLIRLQSDGRTEKASIDRERTLIGRQTGCNLRIRSGEVSREHCEIVVDEGVAAIKDLGSRNGTYVNGVKVVQKRLEPGDLIAVGPVLLLAQIDGEPSTFDAAALYKEGMPGADTPAPQQQADHAEDAPTQLGGGSLLDEIEAPRPSADNEGSSVMEFDFDFEDEEEEQNSQPPL